jgi:hypothetical protein
VPKKTDIVNEPRAPRLMGRIRQELQWVKKHTFQIPLCAEIQTSDASHVKQNISLTRDARHRRLHHWLTSRPNCALFLPPVFERTHPPAPLSSPLLSLRPSGRRPRDEPSSLFPVLACNQTYSTSSTRKWETLSPLKPAVQRSKQSLTVMKVGGRLFAACNFLHQFHDCRW